MYFFDEEILQRKHTVYNFCVPQTIAFLPRTITGPILVSA